MSPIAGELCSAVVYVIDHYSKFEVNLELYGDIRARFVALKLDLEQMAKSDGIAT